jgi:hypothetical protein
MTRTRPSGGITGDPKAECDKATSPGPKKRIGRGECVARGLSETERCDELAAESCDRGSEHTISQSGIVPTGKKGLKHRAGPGIQWRLSGEGGEVGIPLGIRILGREAERGVPRLVMSTEHPIAAVVDSPSGEGGDPDPRLSPDFTTQFGLESRLIFRLY